MSDEYGGMSISDWGSAKFAIQKHLGALAAKNPNYQATYETILIHMIVDTINVKQRPDILSVDDFFTKYLSVFKDGLGINLQSLEPDSDA